MVYNKLYIDDDDNDGKRRFKDYCLLVEIYIHISFQTTFPIFYIKDLLLKSCCVAL